VSIGRYDAVLENMSANDGEKTTLKLRERIATRRFEEAEYDARVFGYLCRTGRQKRMRRFHFDAPLGNEVCVQAEIFNIKPPRSMAIR